MFDVRPHTPSRVSPREWQAACAGDFDCMDLLGAVLLIDCRGVCDGCGANALYGNCIRTCHNTVRLFEPQDIREVEDVAAIFGCLDLADGGRGCAQVRPCLDGLELP